MEQVIVDFFSKASELILHNRLQKSKSLEAVINTITQSNPYRFQLNFDLKFNFTSKIPSQWTTQHNKLLVLEFLLVNKNSGESFLAEQWSFELNSVPDNKLQDTIDSTNTLYKNLAILLRTVSSLTVMLPLYQAFLNNRGGPLSEHFTLENKINFTRKTLSNWHPTSHEENNFANYTSKDLVIPGRNFAFKVMYLKNLKSLLRGLENSAVIDSNYLKSNYSERIEAENMAQGGRQRLLSDEIFSNYIKQPGNAQKMNKKTVSDSTKYNMSLRDGFKGSETPNSDSMSLGGSLLATSPIETQKNLVSNNLEGRSRVNSENYQGKIEKNRPRFQTIDSESSGEMEMYIFENVEEKFTEVLSVKEINVRKEPSYRFSIHPRGSEDEESFADGIRKIEMSELKVSANIRNIEKIIEQSDDDKVAEIIGAIDGLKKLVQSGLLESKGSGKSGNEMDKGKDVQKGLRFVPQNVEVVSMIHSKDSENHLEREFKSLELIYLTLKE